MKTCRASIVIAFFLPLFLGKTETVSTVDEQEETASEAVCRSQYGR